MSHLTITRPDDWHLHLRDDAAMSAVVAHTAERFGRAIIMPNLKSPITTTERALAYRERILTALPDGSGFTPLMTLYLTDNTSADEIRKAAACDHIVAAKLYPAGATTNSDSGVTDLEKIYPALEAMTETGMKLLIHGEVTANDIDIFDREKAFIDGPLNQLVSRFSNLRIVAEHITTADAVQFVESAPDNVAATITAHHLLMNRNDILAGGIHPHHYCLPVLKRERHRQALVEAAISGNPKFFLGTDSAPHTREAKESACGCAGMYTAFAAIELYAEVFDEAAALDKLEPFASFFGPDFYGLPRNQDQITLHREEWTVPDNYPFGDSIVTPLRAGGIIRWRLATH